MKLLVFGKTGQVAREIARNCPDGIMLTQLGRSSVDLMDTLDCARHITFGGFDAVINAAAYTAVDDAEANEALAMTINGNTPGAMARAAIKAGIPFLHISTDYVFDGSGSHPRGPENPTNPLSVYGRSKLAGELAVRAAGGPHVILRTSWVFSSHRRNFVKTMLRLGAHRDRLSIVSDQIGGPTPAADIARTLLRMVIMLTEGAHAYGTYHYCGAPFVSWADFGREIFKHSRQNVCVDNISSADFPTAAVRPKNSRMDCATLETDFGISCPDWRAGLDNVISDLQTEDESL